VRKLNTHFFYAQQSTRHQRNTQKTCRNHFPFSWHACWQRMPFLFEWLATGVKTPPQKLALPKEPLPNTAPNLLWTSSTWPSSASLAHRDSPASIWRAIHLNCARVTTVAIKSAWTSQPARAWARRSSCPWEEPWEDTDSHPMPKP